jgi:hypothetical protein
VQDFALRGRSRSDRRDAGDMADGDYDEINKMRFYNINHNVNNSLVINDNITKKRMMVVPRTRRSPHRVKV